MHHSLSKQNPDYLDLIEASAWLLDQVRVPIAPGIDVPAVKALYFGSPQMRDKSKSNGWPQASMAYPIVLEATPPYYSIPVGAIVLSCSWANDRKNKSRLAVAGLTGVASIAAGTNQTCARLVSGAVDCWGVDVAHAAPAAVGGLAGVSVLTSGYFYSCALLTGAVAKCVGANESGQLGDGTTTTRTTPVIVSGL